MKPEGLMEGPIKGDAHYLKAFDFLLRKALQMQRQGKWFWRSFESQFFIHHFHNKPVNVLAPVFSWRVQCGLFGSLGLLVAKQLTKSIFWVVDILGCLQCLFHMNKRN